MDQLAPFEGKRIEVEVDGQRVAGRVIRGPGRRLVLLEEKGAVGDQGSGYTERLSLLRIWRPAQLADARVVAELPSEPVPPSRTRARKRRPRAELSDAVRVAASDPDRPPDEWEGGQQAWAEAVQAAKRSVDRSRKAMLKALREAAAG